MTLSNRRRLPPEPPSSRCVTPSAGTWSRSWRSMGSMRARSASVPSCRLQRRAPLWLTCWNGCRMLRDIIEVRILCVRFRRVSRAASGSLFSFSFHEITRLYSMGQSLNLEKHKGGQVRGEGGVVILNRVVRRGLTDSDV